MGLIEHALIMAVDSAWNNGGIDNALIFHSFSHPLPGNVFFLQTFQNKTEQYSCSGFIEHFTCLFFLLYLGCQRMRAREHFRFIAGIQATEQKTKLQPISI
jgi:hypothetical protein